MIQLIVFTRFPEAGTTKTRLIPSLGAEQAALLQKKMTERLLAEINKLKVEQQFDLAIHFSGGNQQIMQNWLREFTCIEQHGKNLGEKMENAAQHGFHQGASHVVIMGSDIPALDEPILLKMLSEIGESDIVIGPTCDGGYYLIGFSKSNASKLCPLLFREMSWSHHTVFDKTIQRANDQGFTIATLPLLHDIDTEECLEEARRLKLL